MSTKSCTMLDVLGPLARGTTQRMLNTPTHFNQVAENVSPRKLVGLDVDEADGDQKIHPGNNVACILDQFIQISHLAALAEFIEEELLKMTEFVANGHVQLVVALGREQRSAKFT